MAQPHRLIISFSFIHLNMQHLLIKKKKKKLFTSLLCRFIFFSSPEGKQVLFGSTEPADDQGTRQFSFQAGKSQCLLVFPCAAYLLLLPFILGSHSKLCLFRMITNSSRYARRARASYSRGDTFTPERGCFYSVGFDGKDGTFFTSSPLPCLMAVIRHQGTIIHLTTGSEKHAGSTGP